MPLLVIFRRVARKHVAGWLLGVAVAGTAGCRPAPEPSVLLIVVDTLRADRVGAVAGQAPESPATPGIDGWAAGSARFRRAATTAPFTMPAMASVLTGAWPDRTGVVAHEPGTTLGTWRGDTLGEAARRAGARTFAVIANPWLARQATGFDRGFDEFVRLYRSGQASGASAATAVTDEAIRRLATSGERRFFAWVHYFDPHMPYEPPAEFARAAGAAPAANRVMSDFGAPSRDLARLYRGEGYSREEIDEARRLYDGEVRYADREIARLLAWLEESGRADSTLVVITADHGESLGDHGLYFAHDYTLYDELVRVPLIVHGPGVPAGEYDEPVSLVDVAPTICRLASLPCAGGFDGRDLFSEPDASRTLFAASSPRRARGTPFARLEVEGLGGRWTMAMRGTLKLIRIPSKDGPQLEAYDLARDPGERTPLGDARAKELESRLETWIHRMNEERPAEPPLPAKRERRRDARALRSLGYLQ